LETSEAIRQKADALVRSSAADQKLSWPYNSGQQSESDSPEFPNGIIVSAPVDGTTTAYSQNFSQSPLSFLGNQEFHATNS